MPHILPEQIFFEALYGIWELEKKVYINDRVILKGRGLAAFMYRTTQMLEYNENLTIQNLEFNLTTQAYQSYKYSINDERNILTKSFKDNSLFYNLVFIDNYHAVGQHQCKNDLYKSEYILEEDILTLIYRGSVASSLSRHF